MNAKVYGDPAAIFARSVLPRTTVTQDGCWIFGGAKTSRGYGCVGAGKRGHNITTHRLSVMASGRDIPEGMTVDHMCHDSATCRDVAACEHRQCVNPEHLQVVTPGDNIRRIHESGKCKKGHELTRRPDGKRECRTCRSEYARNRAAGGFINSPAWACTEQPVGVEVGGVARMRRHTEPAN